VKAVALRVTGRVQGVSFRAYAAREARRLEVAGWVRNAADGSVEVHAEGAAGAVDELVAWCRTGSPAAGVEAVEVSEVGAEGMTAFGVRD
jgi:acylphosphatase